MENKKKIRLNLKAITYIPFCLLIIILVLVCILSFTCLSNTKKSLTDIQKVYMTDIHELDTLSKNVETLNNYTLSHIISTNLDKKIETNRKIVDLESTIEKSIVDMKDDKFLSDNYDDLQKTFKEAKTNINQLMAYSANSDSNEAYVLANDTINPLFDKMNNYCNTAVDNIYNTSDKEVSSILVNVRNAKVILLVLMLISIVIVAFAFIFLRRKLIKPLIKTTSTFTDMVDKINDNKGDLSIRMDYLSDDEIGDLNRAVNSFIETLQRILDVIIDKSTILENVVNDVNNSVIESSSNVTDLSAISEELSATMIEVENNTEKVKDNVLNISDEATTIVTNAEQLTNYTKDMSSTADEMEKDAKSSLETIDSNITEILEVLNKAIKDSEQVNQITNLTNDILSISTQTNLLALNASIEAARAGEAGKGFAVVAGEIGQLADSSKNTANTIQEINAVVLEAVTNLADNANKLIEFLKEDILPEFDKFVENSSDYKDKSKQIGIIADNFNNQAIRLNDSISLISESMTSIASSIEEGSNGVTTTAENIQGLATDMSNIEENMRTSNEVAINLKECVAVFNN